MRFQAAWINASIIYIIAIFVNAFLSHFTLLLRHEFLFFF